MKGIEMKRRWIAGSLVCSAALLVACAPKTGPAPEPSAPNAAPAASVPAATAEAPLDVPAGAYTLDPAHTSVIFKVSHLGFSNYTARFRKSSAQLQFDPANLAASTVNVVVDANSLETDYPDPAKEDFNAQLRGEQWLNAEPFPEITFRSTRVEVTGERTMRIHGDLSIRGIARPMVLEAKVNGGYRGHPMDKNARVGFSARGVLKRSDYGISSGIPQPGSTFGIGDDVTVIVETEFSGPPWAEAPAETSAAADKR